MSVKSFVEDHKGVRRAVLGWWMLMASLVVGTGLWHFTTLTAVQVTFVSAVLGVGGGITGFYFWHRGKEERVFGKYHVRR